MSCLTRPSNVRVCQFRHFPSRAFLPPRAANCQSKSDGPSAPTARGVGHERARGRRRCDADGGFGLRSGAALGMMNRTLTREGAARMRTATAVAGGRGAGGRAGRVRDHHRRETRILTGQVTDESGAPVAGNPVLAGGPVAGPVRGADASTTSAADARCRPSPTRQGRYRDRIRSRQPGEQFLPVLLRCRGLRPGQVSAPRAPGRHRSAAPRRHDRSSIRCCGFIRSWPEVDAADRLLRAGVGAGPDPAPGTACRRSGKPRRAPGTRPRRGGTTPMG